MKRIFISLALVASLVFVSVGFDSCKNQKPEDKERNIALAKDIASSVESAVPVVTALHAGAGKLLATAVPIANNVISAVERSDFNSAVALLRELLPIINGVVAQFSNNVQVLGALALANIALHLLINRMAPKVVKAAKARRIKTGNDVIADFAAQPVWGCKYRPDLCPAN